MRPPAGLACDNGGNATQNDVHQGRRIFAAYSAPASGSFFSVITGHCVAISAFSAVKSFHSSGKLSLMENGFHRALRNASFAVDAFIRVDVQHLLPLVETLDGADDYAVRVLAAKTRLRYDVSHGKRFSFQLTFKPQPRGYQTTGRTTRGRCLHLSPPANAFARGRSPFNTSGQESSSTCP